MAILRKLKKIFGHLLAPMAFVIVLLIIRHENNQNPGRKEAFHREFTSAGAALTTETGNDEKPSSTTTVDYDHSTREPAIPESKLVQANNYQTEKLRENSANTEDIYEGIINDTDAIHALGNYTFMMRSDANNPLVTQIYMNGQTEYLAYKKICGDIVYDLGDLPSASVVISFHQNERVESLLHTLHSIHLNSPQHILKEIILIDDNSKKASHKEPFDSYIKDHFPNGLIKIHRHTGPDQLGLIQGRLLGIKMATGDVIVIMDAHMELQPGWLEPLLQAIKNQRNIMATSHLDWMRPLDSDPAMWRYEHGHNKVKTTWVWKSFNFGFRSIRLKEVNYDRHSTEPIDTPMSVGTIWAMDRSFFFEIGGFDENMVLWGGENIDLPIRVHLCSGGRVVNIPCSKAAHQEIRHQRDYRKGWRDKFTVNFKRIAEVWLDGEYKQTFEYYNHGLQTVEPGDLTERCALREKCPRNFSYYMERAFPEMGIDAVSFAWKGVINMATRQCFYYSADQRLMKMANCISYSKEQSLFLDIHGHLRQYLSIFNIKNNKGEYVLTRDDYFYEYFHLEKHTTWIHAKDGCIYSPVHQLCIGADGEKVKLHFCNGTCKDLKMKWRFQTYTHYYKELWEGKLAKDIELKSTTYYKNYRMFLLSEGKTVQQLDIDNSETDFRMFLLHGEA